MPKRTNKPGTFDPVEHRKAKQAARDQDEADLKAGRVTAEELARQNSLFGSFPPGSITIAHDPYAERYRKKLEAKQSREFEQVLKNPPEPNNELKNLMKRKAPWEE